MLILTRRAGEKVVIGEDVTVTVLSVKGNQVRIGIDAPRDIAVNRDEIHQRILKERRALNGDDGPVSTAQNPIRMPSPSDRR